MSEPTNPDQASEASPDQQTQNPATDPSGVRSPWLWMAAGLIAAILVPISLQAVAQSRIPLPAEHTELSSNPAPPDEDAERINVLERENRLANHNRFMIGPGVVMSVVFGLFAGLISQRIVMGIVGAVVGAALAYALPMAATSQVLEFEQQALEKMVVGQGGDTIAMLAHGIQWLVFGVCTAVAVLIGYGKVTMGGKAFAATLLAAALGSVLYVILATVLDPTSQPGNAEPVAGTARFLWTSVPPLLAGFFMARMGQD